MPENPLVHIQPSTEQLEMMEAVRDRAVDLWDILEKLPASREGSLALTNLENAVMWANKAISRLE